MGGKRRKSDDDDDVEAEASASGWKKKTRTTEKEEKEKKEPLRPSMIKNKEKRSELHAKLKQQKKLDKRAKAKARDAALKRALDLGEEVKSFIHSFSFSHRFFFSVFVVSCSIRIGDDSSCFSVASGEEGSSHHREHEGTRRDRLQARRWWGFELLLLGFYSDLCPVIAKFVILCYWCSIVVLSFNVILPLDRNRNIGAQC